MNENDFLFKKSFGQNFLKDKAIIENIVNNTNIEKDSLVIEIGPGAGALTKKLAKVAKNVLCYEIDTRLDEILSISLKDFNNIDIIFDDFMNRDINKDIGGYKYNKLYVVSNLPYYITTPIINKLIDSKLDISRITVMVQKEVGNRFTANIGTRDYSSLTVFLNYYYDVRKMLYVSKNCFIPRPKVDSVVVTFSKKDNRVFVKNEKLFFELVRESFKYKRKNIRNNLKKYDLVIIESVLRKHGFDLNTRAEQISIAVFADISNALS